MYIGESVKCESISAEGSMQTKQNYIDNALHQTSDTWGCFNMVQEIVIFNGQPYLLNCAVKQVWWSSINHSSITNCKNKYLILFIFAWNILQKRSELITLLIQSVFKQGKTKSLRVTELELQSVAKTWSGSKPTKQITPTVPTPVNPGSPHFMQ